jgi:hypothetical protein
MYSNVVGNNNVAVGINTLTNSTSSNNVAVGANALRNNLTGQENVAVGFLALDILSSASYNTALGGYSLYDDSTGTQNTAVGHSALSSNTIGESNTAIGLAAGKLTGVGTNTSAVQSVYLGAHTKASTDAQQNEIVIGYNATGIGSNTAVIGTASTTITELFGKVGINTAAPTARLHLPAGTIVANTAPLKFVAGPVLAVPEAGTIEFDGANFFMTV